MYQGMRARFRAAVYFIMLFILYCIVLYFMFNIVRMYQGMRARFRAAVYYITLFILYYIVLYFIHNIVRMYQGMRARFRAAVEARRATQVHIMSM
jgi:hypothetical protein